MNPLEEIEGGRPNDISSAHAQVGHRQHNVMAPPAADFRIADDPTDQSGCVCHRYSRIHAVVAFTTVGNSDALGVEKHDKNYNGPCDGAMESRFASSGQAAHLIKTT